MRRKCEGTPIVALVPRFEDKKREGIPIVAVVPTFLFERAWRPMGRVG